MQRNLCVGLGLFALVMVSPILASAETISFTPEGTLTVIESTAPLGTPLTYVSGGDGLVGIGGGYPVPDTPANAANNYDHEWLQYLTDSPIIWSSTSPLDRVFAIPGVDHGPSPAENIEFIIWGSPNGTSSWEEGRIQAVYRDGFDTSPGLGETDDYTSLWGFSQPYTYFMATQGDHFVGGPVSPGEGEIDALAAPVPEPASLFLLGTGLIVVARRGLRRRV